MNSNLAEEIEMKREDNDDDSVMNTLELLLELGGLDEQLLFAQHGYVKESTLCKTMHGELYKARTISIETPQQYVVIKRASRRDTNEGITAQNGFKFLVSENIRREASILKELTVSPRRNEANARPRHYNDSIGTHYIVNYIDSFESFDDYYLVMEYVQSEMTLRQFARKCHAYIHAKQLSFGHYAKMLKFLLWQLCSTVHWMHTTKNTCHLDLHAENVMVENAHFHQDQDTDEITIDRNVSIKICDFGVAAQFENADDFSSDKYGLNIENEAYLAPEVFNGEIYDARYADNWALGILLFECLTNQPLYSPLDVAQNSSGYLALHRGRKHLKRYLLNSHLGQYFNPKSFSLLSQLLAVDTQQRLNGIAILRHSWFAHYYREYGNRNREQV